MTQPTPHSLERAQAVQLSLPRCALRNVAEAKRVATWDFGVGLLQLYFRPYITHKTLTQAPYDPKSPSSQFTSKEPLLLTMCPYYGHLV